MELAGSKRQLELRVHQHEKIFEEKITDSLELTFKKTKPCGRNGWMKIIAGQEADFKLLKRLRKIRLHRLKGLYISDVKKNFRFVQEFLEKSVPNH